MEKYEHAPKHQRAHLRVHFMHFEAPHDVEEFRVDRGLVLEAHAHLPHIVTHNAIAGRDAASFVVFKKGRGCCWSGQQTSERKWRASFSCRLFLPQSEDASLSDCGACAPAAGD